MNNKRNAVNIVIQGIPGSFHYEAAQWIFPDEEVIIFSEQSFLQLGESLQNNLAIDYGVMAIENSTAGSIIQNYRIIRENRFRIVAEIYLPIIHNLISLPGQSIEDITEVRSHPMALNQCLGFLLQYPHLTQIATRDTASSVREIAENQTKGIAAIGSHSAAALYNLEIMHSAIQSSSINYTRFFLLQRDDRDVTVDSYNKASIYLRTTHQKGSLLKVLEKIYASDINISKLQSFPIEGNLNKYYFHLDLEFDNIENYKRVIPMIENVTQQLDVLGVYTNGIQDIITSE